MLTTCAIADAEIMQLLQQRRGVLDYNDPTSRGSTNEALQLREHESVPLSRKRWKHDAVVIATTIRS